MNYTTVTDANGVITMTPIPTSTAGGPPPAVPAQTQQPARTARSTGGQPPADPPPAVRAADTAARTAPCPTPLFRRWWFWVLILIGLALFGAIMWWIGGGGSGHHNHQSQLPPAHAGAQPHLGHPVPALPQGRVVSMGAPRFTPGKETKFGIKIEAEKAVLALPTFGNFRREVDTELVNMAQGLAPDGQLSPTVIGQLEAHGTGRLRQEYPGTVGKVKIITK